MWEKYYLSSIDVIVVSLISSVRRDWLEGKSWWGKVSWQEFEARMKDEEGLAAVELEGQAFLETGTESSFPMLV